MSPLDREAVEVFLQEASEHLQYLREYIGVLPENSHTFFNTRPTLPSARICMDR